MRPQASEKKQNNCFHHDVFVDGGLQNDAGLQMATTKQS